MKDKRGKDRVRESTRVCLNRECLHLKRRGGFPFLIKFYTKLLVIFMKSK